MQLLISRSAIDLQTFQKRTRWCDCAAQGFDQCHSNDYLLPVNLPTLDPGDDDDDDRTQDDDGDCVPFTILGGPADSDDPTDGRGKDNDRLHARLLKIVHPTIAWTDCPCEDQPDNYQCPWCN